MVAARGLGRDDRRRARSGYQMERVRAWLDPWADPLGTGFHTIQGLLALGVGGHARDRPRARARWRRARTPSTTSSSPRSARSSGSSAAVVVIAPLPVLAYRASGSRSRRPTPSGRCSPPGITAWLCLQAFINIGVVVALLPITGITLPFISAGGSSLIISFAAVGILLSISRETVEKGTWNDDATADRRRGDGRTHLPGAGRRPVAPRASGRA